MIQRGLDLGYIKPVQQIYTQMLFFIRDASYQELLMRDLP
jgi:hypothetical protein